LNIKHVEATYSTNDIFTLPANIRDCLQFNERRMDTFSRYTYVNCMAECRSAIVNNFCGCVPYNLPNNGSYPKCKMSQLRCVKDNAFRFSGSIFKINNDSSENSRYLRSKCQCFPDCTFYK
jgi:acid-sensing ion channel, other